ncbi:MAG: sigma-70 family RNA polymerase sigma factor [Bacteroidaceae bacterium]|nr:sigma-70 family RNA polymerase sigma factor [Bacteroidaceae bacterium]
MTHAEFKQKFMPLQPMLFREAYRMLCDKFEAEDAVQNLYLRLWEKKNELARLVAPEAYCRTMLHNICIDRWRLLQKENQLFAGDGQPLTEAPMSTFEKNDEKEFVKIYLDCLPLLQRRVVLMRMNGHSYSEIEEITGISGVNIRVIISRLRKRFREYYNDK